jgi:hypothetical protein
MTDLAAYSYRFVTFDTLATHTANLLATLRMLGSKIMTTPTQELVKAELETHIPYTLAHPDAKNNPLNKAIFDAQIFELIDMGVIGDVAGEAICAADPSLITVILQKQAGQRNVRQLPQYLQEAAVLHSMQGFAKSVEEMIATVKNGVWWWTNHVDHEKYPSYANYIEDLSPSLMSHYILMAAYLGVDTPAVYKRNILVNAEAASPYNDLGIETKEIRELRENFKFIVSKLREAVPASSAPNTVVPKKDEEVHVI